MNTYQNDLNNMKTEIVVADGTHKVKFFKFRNFKFCAKKIKETWKKSITNLSNFEYINLYNLYFINP